MTLRRLSEAALNHHRSGMLPWRPLLIAQTADTVYPNLQPIKHGTDASPTEIACWFY